MKLKELAARPQLVKISLDDEDTIKEYGEAVEFWIWDRQPLEKFINMANMRAEDFGSLVRVVNEMVLDESGAPVLTEDETLPTPVLTRVINKVVETLGK
jgi:hypothetical protein